MRLFDIGEKTPRAVLNVSTDDFGDEFYAAMHFQDLPSFNFVPVQYDTWFHLLDMELSIRHEAELCAA